MSMTVWDVWLKCVNIHATTKVIVLSPGSSNPIFEGPMWAAPNQVQHGLVDTFRMENMTKAGTVTEVWVTLAKGVKL